MIPSRSLLVAVPLVALVGCQKTQSAQPATEPTRPIVTSESLSIKRDINYAMSSGSERAYDLYLPKKGNANPPLLIFIHGGAWQAGDKRNHETLGRAFADADVAVAIVNYQLSPKVQHPKHVEDVALAYGHLANNVDGFDPKRIFVMGHSAGANMCGLLAAKPDLLMKVGVNKDHYPKGMIGLQGIYDIPRLVEVWPAYRNAFIERAFGSEEKWLAASPTQLPIELKSPWFVVHASGDELVDVKQSDDFCGHLFINNVRMDIEKFPLDVYDPGRLSHDQVVRELANSKSDLFKKTLSFIEEYSKPESERPQ